MTKAGASKKKDDGGTFDKSVLFEDRRPTKEVEVPPYGTFVVRSLSRQQAIALGDIEGADDIERALIADGCVDPKLSRADVKRWQEVATGMALEPLSDAIAELSGLNEGAEREAVERFPS